MFVDYPLTHGQADSLLAREANGELRNRPAVVSALQACARGIAQASEDTHCRPQQQAHSLLDLRPTRSYLPHSGVSF